MFEAFYEEAMFSFLKSAQEALNLFCCGEGFTALEEKLKEGVDSFCRDFIKTLIESVNKTFVDDRSLRKGWVVERHDDEKTIVSPFGSFTYERTYFRNKKTGEYAYLADKLIVSVNITPPGVPRVMMR